MGVIICCCFSVTKSCPTLCNPMDCSMPGFPVFHYLSEFSQIHVRWVSDATQLSHPLPPTSPPALNLSQHEGLFQWVGSLHQADQSIGASALASVLPMNIQGWFPLGLTCLISLLSKGLSRVFFSTTIQKHHSNQERKYIVNLHHLETLSMYRRCSYTKPFTSLLACHVPKAMLRVGRVTGVWVLLFRLSVQEAEMSSNNP